MTYRKIAGFSLFESLITLFIIAILSFIAIPSLQSLLLQGRADSNLSEITRAIQLARWQSITGGHRVTLCPLEGIRCSGDWRRGITTFIDINGNMQIDPDEMAFAHLNPIPANDFLIYPRKGISFRSDGSLAGFYNGTFHYCAGDDKGKFSASLTVSQTGRVTQKEQSANCD